MMYSNLLSNPFGIFFLGAAFLLSACGEDVDLTDATSPPSSSEEDVQEEPYDEMNGMDYIDDPTGYSGEAEEETRHEVVDLIQKPGKMVDSGEVSTLSGEAIMVRESNQFIIVVRSEDTGEQQAFLLPENDFQRVRVGNRLLPSTLNRWESTGIPQAGNGDGDEGSTLPPSVFDQDQRGNR